MTAPGPNARVACRKCHRPVDFTADVCLKCGVTDPSGRQAAFVGAVVYGLVFAAILTAGYAWYLSTEWERWEAKCAGLPPNHIMYDAPWESAIGHGIGLFLLVWVVTVLVLTHFLKPVAARR